MDIFQGHWDHFHDLCLERVTEDILEEADPLDFFVKHNHGWSDSIPRAITIPEKLNPWFDEKCHKPWKLGEPYTRESDKVKSSEKKLYLLSEGHRHMLGNSSTRENFSQRQNISRSCYYQLILLLSMYKIEWGKYLAKISALPRNI